MVGARAHKPLEYHAILWKTPFGKPPKTSKCTADFLSASRVVVHRTCSWKPKPGDTWPNDKPKLWCDHCQRTVGHTTEDCLTHMNLCKSETSCGVNRTPSMLQITWVFKPSRLRCACLHCVWHHTTPHHTTHHTPHTTHHTPHRIAVTLRSAMCMARVLIEHVPHTMPHKESSPFIRGDKCSRATIVGHCTAGWCSCDDPQHVTRR